MANHIADRTGQRFGRLYVLERAENDKNGRATWLCQCDCGNICIKRSSVLKQGIAQSCGCLAKELASSRLKTHGETFSRLYNIWHGMIQRCEYPHRKDYPRYGGRGIVVCEEWRNSFSAFRDWAIANGYQADLTLERKNYNGNYCPENCCWENQKKQQNNRSSNKMLEFRGETHTLTEWAEILGINRNALGLRLKARWSIERAFTTPVRRSIDGHYVTRLPK